MCCFVQQACAHKRLSCSSYRAHVDCTRMKTTGPVVSWQMQLYSAEQAYCRANADRAPWPQQAQATEHARSLGGKGSDAHKAAVIGDTVGALPAPPLQLLAPHACMRRMCLDALRPWTRSAGNMQAACFHVRSLGALQLVLSRGRPAQATRSRTRRAPR